MFDTPLELGDMVLRLLAACAGGMAIGWERESKNKPAGLRTNILVAVGSAGFTLVSWNLTAHLNAGANDLRVDPLRLVQGIIGGIGFLGAGAIIQSHGTVRGMTTAAGIWVVGGIHGQSFFHNTQEGEEFVGFAGEAAEGGGDFLVSGVSEQADGCVAEGGQILGSVALFDLTLVFAEGHVAYPVHTFDAPVASPAV
jgi:putative Mg2+ transporter-C (MgtC) family protein